MLKEMEFSRLRDCIYVISTKNVDDLKSQARRFKQITSLASTLSTQRRSYNIYQDSGKMYISSGPRNDYTFRVALLPQYKLLEILDISQFHINRNANVRDF